MKLTENTIQDFCDKLASNSPAPGGGSAAALESAMGIALVDMVASLSIGKKKYAEYLKEIETTKNEAAILRSKLIENVDTDKDAFDKVSAALSMAKDTEKEKADRQSALEEALKRCTESPFEIMCNSLHGLEAAKRLVGKSNASAASDLGVAALMLKSAAQSAWLNILINISAITDKEFASHYYESGREILDKAVSCADSIYAAVYAEITKN